MCDSREIGLRRPSWSSSLGSGVIEGVTTHIAGIRSICVLARMRSRDASSDASDLTEVSASSFRNCFKASAISFDSFSVNWREFSTPSGLRLASTESTLTVVLAVLFLLLPFRGGGSGGWLFLFFRLPILLLLAAPSGRNMTVPAELVVVFDSVLPLPNSSYSFSGKPFWPPETLPEAELNPDERLLSPPLPVSLVTGARFLCKLPSLWPS